MKLSEHNILILVVLVGVISAVAVSMPVLAQEPLPLDNPPGLVSGEGTEFVATLGDSVSFTITTEESIIASIHAFTTQSLEICLEGSDGVEATQITISGLPPESSLLFSEDDLRNDSRITVDEFGVYSWYQDLTEPHIILLKPEPSTWYLGDTGWTARGIVTQKDHTYSAWYQLDVPGDDIPYPDRYFILETFGYGNAWAASYGLRDWGSGDIGNVHTLTANHAGPNVTFTGACGPQWHNIVVTYEANASGMEHTIYLDGTFVMTMMSGNLLHETTGLNIGAHRDGYGRNFNGWIDDVAFWDRVLTAEEIAAIQSDAVGDIPAQGSVDMASGLVAYWNFDTNFAATSGGSNFNGVPVNGPVIDTFGQFNGSVKFNRSLGQWVQVNEPVLIQEMENDHVPGTWDQGTKTAVLTEDVFETIQIRGSGITLDGDGYSVNSSSGDGLFVYACYGGTVQNVNINTSGSNGIRVYSGNSNTVQNCRVQNGYRGMEIVYSSNCQVLSNELIEGGVAHGIRIHRSAGAVVADNNIQAYGHDGIFMDGADNTIIRDNTIRGYDAIYMINGCDYNEIYGNTMEGLTRWGIIFNTARTTTFYENDVTSIYQAVVLVNESNDNFIYNNSFWSPSGASTRSSVVAFNKDLPIGGNFWSIYTSPDANGDGIVDTPFTFTGGMDNFPYTTPGGWDRVSLTGTVSTNCDGPMAGVAVELHEAGGEVSTTVTGPDGMYSFANLTRGISGDVIIVLPENYAAVAPETGAFNFLNLMANTSMDFALGCLFDVTGTVSSDCLGMMAGITVGLEAGGDYFPQLTTEDGGFLFEDLPFESEIELTCVLPLGFHAVDPIDGHMALTITQDETAAFNLGCVEVSGTSRGMGYWKHQANVFLRGRGNPHELQEDMETNFPAAIFGHFHENELNAIAVPGVTYMGDDVHVPIDLATIQSTLTVNRGQNMLDRAKQHYLALLLNLASGKIQTFTVVADDGRTASQALQYVAHLINDGIEENDQHSIQISESLNDAQMIGAGVIPDEFVYIAYRADQEKLPQVITLNQNAPNPFNPMTKITFALPSEQRVQIAVYSINGSRVATLLDAVMSRGSHDLIWRGLDDHSRPLPSGAYFYRLESNNFSETKRMVLVR
jgi:parallel beta-helix repeat protein